MVDYKINFKKDLKTKRKSNIEIIRDVISVSQLRYTLEFIHLTNGGAKTTKFDVREIEKCIVMFKRFVKG